MPRLTAEDRAMRRTGMGATDVVEALGLAPWDGAGPMRVYMAKTSDAPDEDVADHLEWGHVMEPVILDWYRRETGSQVANGTRVCHATHKWLWATMDAWTQERLVEVKNVSSAMAWHWDAYAEDGIPRYVLAQVTIGMACSGHRLADVVASIAGRPPFIWTVRYDEELAAMLIGGAEAFWRDVQAGVPPPLDATPSTREYLRRKYPSNVDRVIVDADEALCEVADARMNAAASERRAKLAKDGNDARLLAACGDHDGVKGPGWKMTWRVDKTGVRRQRFTGRGEE